MKRSVHELEMVLVKVDTGAAFATVFRDYYCLDALGLAYSEKQIATFHGWIQTLEPEFETSVTHCLMMAAYPFLRQRLRGRGVSRVAWGDGSGGGREV
jgi:hypothetical protein